jgi:hypothetical protein
MAPVRARSGPVVARRGLAGLGGLVLLLAACAGDLVAMKTGFRNPRLGYTIARPSEEAGEWRRVDLEGADLAFRGPGGATMSLLARCGQARPVNPAILARNLLIGVGDREIERAAPVAHAGHPGWEQVVRVRGDGTPLTLKTVTVATQRCVFDWVLTAGSDFAALEPVFDQWWASFRAEPGPAAEEAPPRAVAGGEEVP